MSAHVRQGGRLEGLIVPAATIAFLELTMRAWHVQSDAIAAPSSIFYAGIVGLLNGSILLATGQTLAAASIGLAIGVSLGIFFGMLLGIFPILNLSMEFTIEALRPIPAVAVIPIALLVFGFGYRMEFAIVAFATFWTTLILSRAAVSNIEPRLYEVARALGLGIWARMVKILLPAALPRIFVALRLSVGIALIVAVTVEIAANPLGLGYRMMEAQSSLNPDLSLAYLVWIGVLGWFINVVLLRIQRWVFARMGGIGLER